MTSSTIDRRGVEVRRAFDALVAGPLHRLDSVHGRGLAELQYLESEGGNEHSFTALKTIAAELKSELDALQDGADKLYNTIRGTPVAERQAVMETAETHKIEIGGLGLQTTPSSMLALTDALVAAHTDDIVAKLLVLNDVGYSSANDTPMQSNMLTSLIWWKMRAAITGNSVLAKDAAVLQQALERGQHAEAAEAQRQTALSPAAAAARRMRMAATPTSSGSPSSASPLSSGSAKKKK
eukprot:gene13441-20169_t